jgi:hypothetical protein
MHGSMNVKKEGIDKACDRHGRKDIYLQDFV